MIKQKIKHRGKSFKKIKLKIGNKLVVKKIVVLLGWEIKKHIIDFDL